MYKVDVPVWLFCEFMRELEKRQDNTPVHNKIWNMWEDTWCQMEAKLIDIFLVDKDSYVEAISEHSFVIENIFSHEWRVVLSVLESTHRVLKSRAIFCQDTEDQDIRAYEVDESAILLSIVRRIVTDCDREYGSN